MEKDIISLSMFAVQFEKSVIAFPYFPYNNPSSDDKACVPKHTRTSLKMNNYALVDVLGSARNIV